MTKALDNLARISAVFGSNPLLVQGPGGNVSAKDGDTLWIKASGRWLAEALIRDIFLPVSRREVLEITGEGRESYTARGNHRPSVETPLHALMPQRIILHLHMLDAVIHAAHENAQSRLNGLLAGLFWRMLPYARPGLPLSRLVQTTLEENEQPVDVFILANHGIIIGAEDEEGAIFLVNELSRRLWLAPRPLSVPNIPRLSAINDAEWRIPLSPWPHALAFGEVASALCRGGPLMPDHVVFLGRHICVIEEEMPLKHGLRLFHETYGHEPLFAVAPGCGVLFSPTLGNCAEAMIGGLAHVALRMPKDAVLNPMSVAALDELDSWDGEKWRRTLDQTPTVCHT